MELDEILRMHKRIAIAGGPLTGKTTIAVGVSDRPVYHTDEYMDLPWSEQPLQWLTRLENEPCYVLEGVQVPRTLRKGLQVDAVVWLEEAKVQISPKQTSMAKAVRTVYNEWRSNNQEIPEYNL